VVEGVATLVRDLGLPTIIGALVGAGVTHFAAKARGQDEHARTIDLLVWRDERRTAVAMLDAVRDMRNRINAGEVASFGALHNEWSDRILGPARLIKSDEIAARATAGTYAIFVATLVRGEYVTYAVLRGALDVEDWLEAWLRREPAPPAHLPHMDEIQRLVRVDGGRISMDRLNDVLQARA
jgi:hypothetical protein